MVRPYYLDLRERAIAALEAGDSCRRVADRFGLAVSTVVKWGQRYRETGTVAHGKYGGHKRHSLEAASRSCPSSGGGVPGQAGAGTAGSLGRIRHRAEPGIDTPLSACRRTELQKKARSPTNRTDLRSPAAVPAGDAISEASIPAGWSSSTRPGPRPTWRRSGAGAKRESG